MTRHISGNRNSPTLALYLGMCLALGWAAAAGECADHGSALARRSPHPDTGGPPASRLRMDVKLVMVPVTVTNPLGKPVLDLPRDRFRLLEDGVEQKIATFSCEDAPVSMGVLVDASGSMKGRMRASIDALRQVFQTTIPGDEFFLVRFSGEAKLVAGFTWDAEQIYEKLGFIRPQGWTALLDAVYLGINQMKHAQNARRVLLVLSDGADNNSRYSAAELKQLVVESDSRIFAIGLFTRSKPLQQLAEETGGRLLEAHNIEELPELVQKLSTEIRSQYMLGYSSHNPENDGRYRKVKVELRPAPELPPLHVSWRRGYRAPGD